MHLWLLCLLGLGLINGHPPAHTARLLQCKSIQRQARVWPQQQRLLQQQGSRAGLHLQLPVQPLDRTAPLLRHNSYRSVGPTTSLWRA